MTDKYARQQAAMEERVEQRRRLLLGGLLSVLLLLILYLWGVRIRWTYYVPTVDQLQVYHRKESTLSSVRLVYLGRAIGRSQSSTVNRPTERTHGQRQS